MSATAQARLPWRRNANRRSRIRRATAEDEHEPGEDPGADRSFGGGSHRGDHGEHQPRRHDQDDHDRSGHEQRQRPASGRLGRVGQRGIASVSSAATRPTAYAEPVSVPDSRSSGR